MVFEVAFMGLPSVIVPKQKRNTTRSVCLSLTSGMAIISHSGTQNGATHRRQTTNRTTGAYIAAIGSE
jgi:hypothetical protein